MFGTVLRELRVARNLSLGDLARFLGVATTYISAVERGRSPPLTPGNILRLQRLGFPAQPLLLASAEQRGHLTVPWPLDPADRELILQILQSEAVSETPAGADAQADQAATLPREYLSPMASEDCSVKQFQCNECGKQTARTVDARVSELIFDCPECPPELGNFTMRVSREAREKLREGQPMPYRCPRGHQQTWESYRVWLPVNEAGYTILERATCPLEAPR